MKYFILVVILILFYRCTPRDVKTSGSITRTGVNIVIPTRIEEVRLSEIVGSFRYVKLQLTPNSLIGEIRRTLFYDDLIIVMDNEKNKGVYIFEKDGSFLNCLKNFGDGPSEWAELSDITIDKENGFLVVLDRIRRKILCYDFKGQLVKQRSVEYMFSGINYVSRDRYLLYNNFDDFCEYKFYDLHWDSIKGEGVFNSRHTSLASAQSVLNNNLFAPFGSSSIFKIGNDSLETVYSLGNISLEQRVHKLDRKEFEQELIKLNMVYDIKTIHESKDYLYFQIKQGGINYCILYGMKSGKVKKFKTWNNDINFFGFSIPAATYGNEFVSVVDAYIIEILQNQFKNSRSVEEYQNYLNGLDSFSKDVLFNIQSSDNPILCFYTFNL